MSQIDVEDEHIGSGLDRVILGTNEKGKTVLESSPAVTLEPSKKQARQRRRDSKTQAEMALLQKQLKDINKKMALLERAGKKKGKAAASPRESGKGQPSKRAVDTVDVQKGIEVSPQYVVKKKLSDSVGSSGRSLPTETHIISDPHSIGLFDTVKDVPPCEVNSEGAPVGKFWKHMQSYTHNRAPWIFEWDIPWTRQSKVAKRLFASRVQVLYPGNYDIDFVLEDVATNIRQRRQRIRKQMIKNNSKMNTPIQHGLTLKSWNNIWASITNKEYQEKSQKCKAAATARTERMKFTHRLGSVGVAGFINLFVSVQFNFPSILNFY